MHGVDNSQGSSVTPFFVRRWVYLTFFGRLESDHGDSESPATQPPVGEPHASPISTSRGLSSDQLPRTHGQDDEVIGQEQMSENDPDADILSEPQDEQTTSEATEEMDCEIDEIEGREQEDNSEDLDEAQAYINQLPDTTHLFDSPPPSQSLQLYRNPPSIEDVQVGVMNENGNGNWDDPPPSILSSSFYSEEAFVEEDNEAEAEAGYEEQAPPDERAPLPKEAPSEVASPARDTAPVNTAADGAAKATQDRFKFILRDGDDWTTMEEYSFTSSLSTLVKNTAEKHAAQGRHLLDVELWSLHPSQCFEAALAHGTNIILLFPAGQLCIDKRLAASAAALCPDAGPLRGRTRKRAAHEDISQQRLTKKRDNR